MENIKGYGTLGTLCFGGKIVWVVKVAENVFEYTFKLPCNMYITTREPITIIGKFNIH